ncbi:MAG TPA: class I SAM-dependent methyltransferase [Leptolyngbyaceae cyanobacterium]
MTLQTHHFDHEKFARVYNQAWGPQYCDRIPLIEKLLLPYMPPGANILDLCCGTAQTTRQIINRGYQVTGIEEFKDMLNYAHQNVPDGKFILNNIRTFELPPTFHGIYSITHGLDYVMTLDELKSVFKKTYQALLENGIFLLFLRLIGHSQTYYNQNGKVIDGDVTDNLAWAIGSKYHPEQQISELLCTAFELLEEKWQRSDFIWLLKSYTRTEIESVLAEVGFADVKIYDNKGNLAEPDYDRVAYFVCRK